MQVILHPLYAGFYYNSNSILALVATVSEKWSDKKERHRESVKVQCSCNYWCKSFRKIKMTPDLPNQFSIGVYIKKNGLDPGKWSSGWLESSEGLLLATDILTTCAEAIYTITDNWLWRWLLHRLLQCQLPTVLLRAPVTQMIIFNQWMESNNYYCRLKWISSQNDLNLVWFLISLRLVFIIIRETKRKQ